MRRMRRSLLVAAVLCGLVLVVRAVLVPPERPPSSGSWPAVPKKPNP